MQTKFPAIPDGTLVIVWLIVVMAFSARTAAVTINAGSASDVLQGATDVQIPFFLNEGAKVSALQFDLSFNAGPLILMHVAPGPSAIEAEKDVSTNSIDEGVERVLVAGLNQNVIPDGHLLTLAFTVAPDAPPGSYPLVLSAVLAVSSTGLNIDANGESGTIEITVKQAIVLTGKPRLGKPPLQVHFDASLGSNSGDVLKWHWDFGDGMSRDTDTRLVSHLYLNDGAYDVHVSAVLATSTVTAIFPEYIRVNHALSLDPIYLFSTFVLCCLAGIWAIAKRGTKNDAT